MGHTIEGDDVVVCASVGDGVAGGVDTVVSVVVVVFTVVSAAGASPAPVPQDATKSPMVRASMLIFTNFIILILKLLYLLIPVVQKSNPKF